MHRLPFEQLPPLQILEKELVRVLPWSARFLPKPKAKADNSQKQRWTLDFQENLAELTVLVG